MLFSGDLSLVLNAIFCIAWHALFGCALDASSTFGLASVDLVGSSFLAFASSFDFGLPWSLIGGEFAGMVVLERRQLAAAMLLFRAEMCLRAFFSKQV